MPVRSWHNSATKLSHSEAKECQTEKKRGSTFLSNVPRFPKGIDLLTVPRVQPGVLLIRVARRWMRLSRIGGMTLTEENRINPRKTWHRFYFFFSPNALKRNTKKFRTYFGLSPNLHPLQIVLSPINVPTCERILSRNTPQTGKQLGATNSD